MPNFPELFRVGLASLASPSSPTIPSNRLGSSARNLYRCIDYRSYLHAAPMGHEALPLVPPSSSARLEDEISSLKTDVRFLTLVITVLLKRLNESKTMSLDDVQDLIDEVDELDGTADRGLEPGVLRGILGVLKQDSVRKTDVETKTDAEKDVLERIAEIHRRYR